MGLSPLIQLGLLVSQPSITVALLAASVLLSQLNNVAVFEGLRSLQFCNIVDGGEAMQFATAIGLPCPFV
jgi:hypothetical protein